MSGDRRFSVNGSGGFLGALGGNSRTSGDGSACNCEECSGDDGAVPPKEAAPAGAANDSDDHDPERVERLADRTGLPASEIAEMSGAQLDALEQVDPDASAANDTGDDGDLAETHSKVIDTEAAVFDDPNPVLSEEGFEALPESDREALIAYRLRRLGEAMGVDLLDDASSGEAPGGSLAEKPREAANAVSGDPSNYGRPMFLDGGAPQKRSHSKRTGSFDFGVNYSGISQGDAPPKRPPLHPNSDGSAPPKESPDSSPER